MCTRQIQAASECHLLQAVQTAFITVYEFASQSFSECWNYAFTQLKAIFLNKNTNKSVYF